MSEIKHPYFSVIVPFYRDWHRLGLCVEALLQQTFPLNEIEIILVNNDLDKLIPVGLPWLDKVKLVWEQKKGSYAARNKGIELSKGQILCFTDSDCIPANDWLENAYKCFQDPLVDRVGGKISLFYIDSNKKKLAELYEDAFAFNQKQNVEELKGAVTANLFVRKTVFDIVGTFNDQKFSGEDFGWNRRANRYQFRLAYAENVVVAHPARSSLKLLALKKRRVYGGIKQFNWNNPIRLILSEIFFIPLNFLVQFVIPGSKIVRDSRYTFWERIKVLYVLFYLYLVVQVEHYRLFFGGEKIRI